MASIDEQIKANNLKIESNLSKIKSLKESALGWIKDGQDDNCGKILLKSKRTACELEAKRKIDLGNSRLAEAKILEQMNTQLYADNKALTAQRDAEAQSMIELSKLGTTTAAVQTKATADAEAAKKVAEAEAAAIGTKATAEASTTETDSKRKMMITTIVVIVVVLVISIVAYKKFKKIKKK